MNRENRFDRDLAMPGMNGYEIARCLRAHSATRDSILVAVTGYAQADKSTRIQDAGFNYHLVKPVEFDALEQLLASIAVQASGEQLTATTKP